MKTEKNEAERLGIAQKKRNENESLHPSTKGEKRARQRQQKRVRERKTRPRRKSNDSLDRKREQEEGRTGLPSLNKEKSGE